MGVGGTISYSASISVVGDAQYPSYCRYDACTGYMATSTLVAS